MDNIMDQNIKTLDESRKWILQTFETLKTSQTDLYDDMQLLNQLISEHKIAYDNVCNDKLNDSQKMSAYNDALEIRNKMNLTLDAWFEKYSEVSF